MYPIAGKKSFTYTCPGASSATTPDYEPEKVEMTKKEGSKRSVTSAGPIKIVYDQAVDATDLAFCILKSGLEVRKG